MKIKNIFYMHIAKTSGTSLNDFFSSKFGDGDCLVHFENAKEWRENKNLDELLRKRFLSGHVRLPIFLSRSSSVDFVKFTMLRDPLQQTISHIAWVRHLCEPYGERHFKHAPHYIQELSLKLKSTQLSQPEAVADFVASMSPREKELFDNCQTRYLLSVPGTVTLSAAHTDEAIRNLGHFEVVGISEMYLETILLICSRFNWRPPKKADRLNVSRSKFGLDCGHPGLVNALQDLIKFDAIVYRDARTRFIKSFYELATSLHLAFPDAGHLIDLAQMTERLSALQNREAGTYNMCDRNVASTT